MQSDSALEMERERRGRLAAEHMSAQRERELTSQVTCLEATARRLTHEIEAKRRELARLERTGAGVERAREIMVVRSQPQKPEHLLWAALQTVPHGFAIFDKEGRLVLANAAYLSLFDGLTEAEPGITYDRLCELLTLEGIVDASPDADTWRARMKDRWREDDIPPEVLRIFDGSFVKLVDHRLPDGGIVTLTVDETRTRRILDALPDGFVIFEGGDKVVTANNACLDLVGLTRDNLDDGAIRADLLADAGSPERRGRGIEEISMADGPRFRSVDVALPDGGRAGLRIDTTGSTPARPDISADAGCPTASAVWRPKTMPRAG